MKEIGGYIELDTYTGSMLYEDGIKLNCGRNALAYIVKAKKINKIYFPRFMCDSNDKVLFENDVEVIYYNIGIDFKPRIEERDGWLYIVNYYGQLSNEYISTLGKYVIVDNAQAYFQCPVQGVDTIYTCRKFFGVPDGAILYTDKLIEITQRDESYNRMNFLLGRFERTAGEFYQEYVDNNHFFKNEPIKIMSKLTENLLHGLDYDAIKKKRNANFLYLDSKLGSINKLTLNIPDGAFMYPLYLDNGFELRKKLQELKLFIPTLWPAVFNLCSEDELEYDMAKNILPIPVDQRYQVEDMEYIVNVITSFIGGKQ